MTEIKKTEHEPGKESVWDYPLPPAIENCVKHIRVICEGTIIADSIQSKRVLEKGNPPVYYIPPKDVKMKYLSPADNKTMCEWKGEANYYHLNIGDKQVHYACWYYPNPVEKFKELKNYIAFYPQKMDECYIDNELVTPQPGKYYGGWVTKNITGPFNGEE
jgi:uncharacterized protein (DUF427 family)